tara:strand:- start:678 stop:788 length:111 start_codon:yes stop_codon:yes gene_type:complete
MGREEVGEIDEYDDIIVAMGIVADSCVISVVVVIES